MALVAERLAPVAKRLEGELGLDDPFHDPGVGVFGLENAVFALGDTFVEVVAPVRDDATAGRYLKRRGGDAGYMAIFQVPDLAAARSRLDSLGVRVVWRADHPDIAGTHLHPKDVPGAIVSLDWADPPGSWRWAGPAWTGGAPAGAVAAGGIEELTVRAVDPAGLARRWGEVLGIDAATVDGAPGLVLDDGRQRARFVPAPDEADEGIAEVVAALAGAEEASVDVGTARVRVRDSRGGRT